MSNAEHCNSHPDFCHCKIKTGDLSKFNSVISEQHLPLNLHEQRWIN
uniref:Uncharacterized protein n=1 Tax=Anguilla anguilla TaxID=7936 RepID=A0A0E9TBI8_ANGAN